MMIAMEIKVSRALELGTAGTSKKRWIEIIITNKKWDESKEDDKICITSWLACSELVNYIQ